MGGGGKKIYCVCINFLINCPPGEQAGSIRISILIGDEPWPRLKLTESGARDAGSVRLPVLRP